jgi:acyl-CoA synthetase (AMP-forming)/AMP-acid ligase II
MELAIIRIVDEPIGSVTEAELLSPGEIGEVIVRGPGVSQAYFGRPQSNALAKVFSPEGIWHRMGDCGYFDQQGRLWFCGRKDHRFVSQGIEMFPVMQEGLYNRHPEVRRTALVAVRDGRGSRWPVLVVEPRRARLDEAAANRLKAELRELGPPIRDILFSRRFPVDVRHNIKIDRIALGQVAERSLRTHRWT